MRTTVIIPTYNHARFVREAIDSVLTQTVQDFEIIVIDDGSTDDTPDVLSTVRDPRVTCVRTVNQGLSAARTEGLRRARGEYVAFLDADDRWRPEKLERQLAMMESEPGIGAVFTNLIQFDGNTILGTDQFTYFPELAQVPTMATAGGGRRVLANGFETFVLFAEFPTWIQTVLFRRTVIADVKFPRWPANGKKFSWGDDTYFCLRAYERAAVGFIETPLVEIRRHGNNMTHDLSHLPHARLEILRVLENEIEHEGPRNALLRRLGRAWVDAGHSHLVHGRIGRALHAFGRALPYRGFRLSALKRLVLFPLQAPLYWGRTLRRNGVTRTLACLWSGMPVWELPIWEIPL